MSKRDISNSRAARSLQRALAEAGVTLGDLSFVETHDWLNDCRALDRSDGLVPEGRGATAIRPSPR